VSKSEENPQRTKRRDANFPLPSTGRGIEGEGWLGLRSSTMPTRYHIPTPHPVEGRGRKSRRVWVYSRCLQIANAFVHVGIDGMIGLRQVAGGEERLPHVLGIVLTDRVGENG
jgi:hypothetical protein